MTEVAVGHSGRWIKLILLCLAAAFVALFTVQNMGRESELSLNLWVVAYKLKAPVPIPYMLLTAFGSGLLLAGFLGIIQRMGLARKLRDLEQDTARSSLREPDDDWT
jgi:uncharacterized integral membrane protein